MSTHSDSLGLSRKVKSNFSIGNYDDKEGWNPTSGARFNFKENEEGLNPNSRGAVKSNSSVSASLMDYNVSI